MATGARVAFYAGEWWASTPYLETFVIALRETVPAWARHWDKDRKMWHVAPEYKRELERVLEVHYGGVQWVEPAELGLGARAQHRQPGGQAEAYAALHLLPTAPAELVQAAYRCLAKLNHPDLGGDTSAMQAINAAYAELEQVSR